MGVIPKSSKFDHLSAVSPMVWGSPMFLESPFAGFKQQKLITGIQSAKLYALHLSPKNR